MTPTNPYTTLLQQLLQSPNKSLTITTPVSVQAVRKGVKKALEEYNGLNDLMGLPSEWTGLTITSDTATSALCIELTNDSSITAKGSTKGGFSFTIVEDSNNDPEESS